MLYDEFDTVLHPYSDDVEFVWAGLGAIGHSTAAASNNWAIPLQTDESFSLTAWSDWLEWSMDVTHDAFLYHTCMISISPVITRFHTNDNAEPIVRHAAEYALSLTRPMAIQFVGVDDAMTRYVERPFPGLVCDLGLDGSDTVFFKDDFPMYDCDDHPRDPNDLARILSTVISEWDKTSSAPELGLVVLDDELSAIDSGTACYDADVAAHFDDFLSGTKPDSGVSLTACDAPAIRVATDGDPNAIGDDPNWADATTLLHAFAIVQPGQDIWVKSGAYKPTSGSDRSASFALPNAVRIYGGFDSSETALNQRDVAANVTILSGEIGDPNDVEDNSFHVVTVPETDPLLDTWYDSIILDGFTIEDGRADGEGDDATGGGIRDI